MGLLDTIKSKLKVTEKPIGIAVDYDKDGIPTIHAHKSEQIKTLEALLSAAEIDREMWEVEKFTPNVWNVFSNANGLIHLWQAKAVLKKRDFSQKQIAQWFHEALSKCKIALKTPILKADKTPTGKMFLLGVPDLHLGKYAWSEETGHGNWDCKIAQNAWEEAIDDLLSRAPDCDECWFPLGNDFFNVDDYLQNTTNGTHQDEDGRWQKTFRYGVEMTKWAIARCRRKFPKVKVIMVYGNHDRQRSWYLGELLLELSNFMDGVEVDNRPLDRKYFKWGQTGIGVAHGDRLKEKDLANLCQNEAREIWGTTKRFELILGHIHNPVVKTLGGVLTRWLSALCPPDMWHSKSGYTMAEKTATGLVYDQVGMINQLTHYPDTTKYL